MKIGCIDFHCGGPEAEAELAAGVQAAVAAGRVHVALQSLHVLLLSQRSATIFEVNSTCGAEAEAQKQKQRQVEFMAKMSTDSRESRWTCKEESRPEQEKMQRPDTKSVEIHVW